MQIKEFTLANEEKYGRAINGSMGSLGQLAGGVGENASDKAKLAEYDRLGGLVLKGKYKVKMGSFYDFEKKAPRKTPDITLVLTDFNGEKVEIKDGEDIPLEVKAAEMKDAKKKAKKVKKPVEEEE